jgi:hypothetical protein
MGLRELDAGEKKVVFECLRAAVDGPFFPDWEFHTLFGLQRGEVAKIASSCPSVDDSDDSVALAIHNSMGNLLGYPHGEEKAWRQFISVTPQEVERIFRKWKQA